MLETVNTTVANATVLRASAEQAGFARSTPAAPVASPDVPIELPKAPFISPVISLDLNYDKAVLQIRDSETGDVVQQFPTESRLAEIRRAKVALESRELVRSEPQRREPLSQKSGDVPVVQSDAAPVKSSPSPTINVSPEIITVQEATSAPPANISISPQIAAAALSAGAQSGVSSSSGVSVLA